MEDKKVVYHSYGGMSIFGIITIVFITLKLAQVGSFATMSWVWVFSPIWFPILLGLGIVCVVFLGMLIFSAGHNLLHGSRSAIEYRREIKDLEQR